MMVVEQPIHFRKTAKVIPFTPGVNTNVTDGGERSL